MKSLEISFMTWGRCTKYVEVDDDYELKTDDSVEFMENLQEEYPDEFDEDLLTDDFRDVASEMATCDIEQVGMDYIESVVIYDSSGRIVLEKEFKKVQVS